MKFDPVPRFLSSTLFCCAGLVLGTAVSPGGAAEPGMLVLSANDQEIAYRDNRMIVLDNPPPGSLTMLRWIRNGVEQTNLEGVPVSVIGPPTSLAIRPDGKYAIAANSMKAVLGEKGWVHAPDNRVSLLEIAGDKLRVVDTAETGTQPSGLSFAPDGSFALLANRAEGTVSALAIENGKLKELGRVKIAEPKESLAHVQVSPDGKTALASLQGIGEVLILGLENPARPVVQKRLSTGGKGPYAVRFGPRGGYVAVANALSNTVSIITPGSGNDWTTASIQQQLPTGRIAEGLDISPDGLWLAASCFDGANLTDKNNPHFGETGRVYLFKRSAERFEPAGSLPVSGGPQLALFAPDSRRLIVANTGKKQLLIYTLEKGEFGPDGEAVSVPGEPVALARPGG